MAISDSDIKKLSKALLPEIERIVEEKSVSQTDELRAYVQAENASQTDELRLYVQAENASQSQVIMKEVDTAIKESEIRVKQYIHEGVDAVIEGVDNLNSEKDYDSRIKKLEKIHPHSRHPVN